MDMRRAIETGDATAVRALVAKDPGLANALIEWGKDREIHTHPLHFVSDMLFAGTLERGKEIPVVEALLDAGADYNYAAPNGETPLIGAASLLAEDVGLRLLAAGANPGARGLFRETALHWAANVGLDRLVGELIARGSDVDLKDGRYQATPLGWAIHVYVNARDGSKGRHREVVELLVSAGATVDPKWLEEEKIRGDRGMLEALTSRGPRPKGDGH